jgi:hypothetical protein
MMERDIADILDRYSIVILKNEHSPNVCNVELELYQKELHRIKERYPNFDWDGFLEYLKKINAYIWELEADIRQGAIDNEVQEVGRRAILIRKFNSLRVGFKNIINQLVGEGFKEIKVNHISE